MKACNDAQLSFVDSLPEKYNTFVGSGGGQLSEVRSNASPLPGPFLRRRPSSSWTRRPVLLTTPPRR